MNNLKCLSLFSSGGVAEAYFKEIGIDVVLANEIEKQRCDFYQNLYPRTKVIEGDVKDKKIRSLIIQESIKKNINFIIATPPCQGMSRHGKRDAYDPRNQLIYYAIEIIKEIKPEVIMIENVPRQLTTLITHNKKRVLIPEYIKQELKEFYKIQDDIFNAADYGVPQRRQRSIIRMFKKNSKFKSWNKPKKEKYISLKDAIGNLPSLDPLIRQDNKRKNFPDFEKKKKKGMSVSKWHYPPTHSWHHVEWMQHTPPGKTAFENKIYFPKLDSGRRIKGRISTYKRFAWDKPANTITQNNGVISSAICVHPGRELTSQTNERDRIFSDARVLTIYELMIVSSLPKDWDIPDWADEKLIRNIIGEGIPPLLVKKILQELT